jgi:predicted O-methyltransferase YrrM
MKAQDESFLDVHDSGRRHRRARLPDLREILTLHHDDTGGFARHYMTLYSIVLGLETRLAFEFGCGRSTPVILKALEQTGGKLVTAEIRDLEDTDNDEELLERYRGRWDYRQADSRQVARDFTGALDFVLHDGSHDADVVREDLQLILPHMRRNAILAVHDTEHPTQSYGLDEAVDVALSGIEHERMTLPYGYGLTMVRIEEDLGNGVVELAWKKRSAP